MASSKPSIDVMLVDSGAVDCGVCQCLLKPPIFQCEVGHMVCSECREKMAGAETCHVCRRALAGGYKRCYGAEHIVECLRVPCPNKAYGCSDKLARYDESAHLEACRYRPFHCPAEDCTFVTGGLPALRYHFVRTHRWPSTTVSDQWPVNYGSANLALVDGFNLIDINPSFLTRQTEIKRSGLVLVKVTRESYGRTITAIDIRPRNSKKCRLKFEYEAPCGTHRREYEFNVAYTDLSASDGLSSFLDGCFDFVVPKSAQPLDVDTIKVALTCWYLDPESQVITRTD